MVKWEGRQLITTATFQYYQMGYGQKLHEAAYYDPLEHQP